MGVDPPQGGVDVGGWQESVQGARRARAAAVSARQRLARTGASLSAASRAKTKRKQTPAQHARAHEKLRAQRHTVSAASQD